MALGWCLSKRNPLHSSVRLYRRLGEDWVGITLRTGMENHIFTGFEPLDSPYLAFQPLKFGGVHSGASVKLDVLDGSRLSNARAQAGPGTTF
jgi:hypothetical protein